MHTFSFEGFSAATLFPLSSDIGRGILKQKAFSPPSNPCVRLVNMQGVPFASSGHKSIDLLCKISVFKKTQTVKQTNK